MTSFQEYIHAPFDSTMKQLMFSFSLKVRQYAVNMSKKKRTCDVLLRGARVHFTAFIKYFLLGSVAVNCFLSKVKKLEKTEREFQRLEHNIERLQVKAKAVSLIILKCVSKPPTWR